ncbi:MAG: hypothetical protein ACRC46_11610 [Thermoguttaceae bacterium]
MKPATNLILSLALSLANVFVTLAAMTLAAMTLAAGDGLSSYPVWLRKCDTAAMAKCDDATLAKTVDEAILPYRGDLSTEERVFLADEFVRRRTAAAKKSVASLRWAAAVNDANWLTLTPHWDADQLDIIALSISLERLRIFGANGNELALASRHGTLEVPLVSQRDTAAIPLRFRGDDVPARVVVTAEILFAAVPHQFEIDVASPQRWRELPLRCGDTTVTLQDATERSVSPDESELVVAWSLSFRGGDGVLDSHRLAWLTANARRPLAELVVASSAATVPPTTLRITPQNADTAGVVATFRFNPHDANERLVRINVATVVGRQTVTAEVDVVNGESTIKN